MTIIIPTICISNKKKKIYINIIIYFQKYNIKLNSVTEINKNLIYVSIANTKKTILNLYPQTKVADRKPYTL